MILATCHILSYIPPIWVLHSCTKSSYFNPWHCCWSECRTGVCSVNTFPKDAQRPVDIFTQEHWLDYFPEKIVNSRYIYTRTLVGLFPQNIVNSRYVCTGLLYTLQCTFAFCSKCNLRGYWIQHLSVREQKNAIFCIKDCGSPDHKYKPSLLFLEFLLPAGWILGYHLFDTNIFVCIVFKKWYIQIFICIYIRHNLVCDTFSWTIFN